jgi:hypothetical protein
MLCSLGQYGCDAFHSVVCGATGDPSTRPMAAALREKHVVLWSCMYKVVQI